jgi:hypothetical protein
MPVKATADVDEAVGVAKAVTPPSQNVKNFGFDLWKNLRSKPTEDF